MVRGRIQSAAAVLVTMTALIGLAPPAAVAATPPRVVAVATAADNDTFNWTDVVVGGFTLVAGVAGSALTAGAQRWATSKQIDADQESVRQVRRLEHVERVANAATAAIRTFRDFTSLLADAPESNELLPAFGRAMNEADDALSQAVMELLKAKAFAVEDPALRRAADTLLVAIKRFRVAAAQPETDPNLNDLARAVGEAMNRLMDLVSDAYEDPA